jgi:hypothetical protein
MFQGWSIHPCPVAHSGTTMVEHGPTFMAAERNKALAADGIQTHVRGQRREHARVPNALPLPPVRACAKAIARQRATAAWQVGRRGSVHGGKRSPRLDLASKTVCMGARAHRCARECAHAHAGVTAMAGTETAGTANA